MKFNWKTCLPAAATAFGLYLCILYWPAVAGLLSTLLGAAAPLFIGVIIAYLLNIPMKGYERHFFPRSKKPAVARLRRPVCLLLSFLTMIAIVVLVFSLVLPQLASCFQLVFDKLPGFMERTVDRIVEWGVLPEDILASLENIDWQSRFGEILQMVTSSLGSVVDVVVTTVTSFFSAIVTGLLSTIFAVYLLLGQNKLRRQWNRVSARYLRPRWREKLNYVMSVFNGCFHKYIVGQCTEAVILGMLCTFGMLILQLPYATMIGALIAFTALIPVAGAFIGAAVGVFMILTVSPIKALIFLIFILVLQQLENNLIYPKVVGSSIGLPAIWVLAAVTVGGGIMGVFGMLLGVPITAAIYQIVRDDVRRNALPEDANEPEAPGASEPAEET